MKQITGYKIVDRRTGTQIGGVYPYSRRNVARRRANNLDMRNGAYRYKAMPIFSV